MWGRIRARVRSGTKTVFCADLNIESCHTLLANNALRANPKIASGTYAQLRGVWPEGCVGAAPAQS